MKLSQKLTVLGSINVDHVLNVNDFPRPGETITGHHYQLAYGGKGANQAVAAGRAGANISFIACIGEDSVGKEICAQLVKDSIDITSVGQAEGYATGVAMIYLNGQGENTIGIYAGANAAVTPEYLLAHKVKLTESQALLMQLETPLETVELAAEIARQHQVMTVLNPAPAVALSDRLLSLIDIITPNETEAEVLTGIKVTSETDAAKAAAVLHAKGINTVLITLGHRGVWCSQHSETGKRINGFSVTVKDTVAAGDTFNGAFITALLEGQSLQDAVRFGQAAAAISVSRVGAQTSIPWRKEIEDFLA